MSNPKTGRPPKVNRDYSSVEAKKNKHKWTHLLQIIRLSLVVGVHWITLAVIVFSLCLSFCLCVSGEYPNGLITILVTYMAVRVNKEVS